MSSAQAQPGTITSVDFQNEEFTDGSRQQINVDWTVDGTAENPVTVSIDLPEGLQGYTDRFDMIGADGEVAGECVVSTDRIDCVVDPEYVNSHPRNMSGSFFFFVDVRLGNDETVEHEFVFGSFTTSVTVTPPTSNPCTENCDFTGQGGYKSGWVSDLGNDELVWRVGVPAPADGIPAGRTVVVKDHLDTDLYELVGGPTVREARSLALGANGRWAPAYAVKSEGVTVSENGTRAQFESVAGLTGADLPDGHREIAGSVYLVDWVVKVRAGIESGVEYTNTAEWSVEGQGSGEGSGRVVRQGGGGTVVGENEGKFTLTKELAGDTTLNPEFTVKYSVDGQPQDDIVIGAGETFTSATLPQGTTIALEEVRQTAPTNVTWADPVFVLPDGTETDRLELTFSDAAGTLGKVTEIRLLNEATLDTGSIAALKRIVNDDGVLLPEDLAFELDYAWEADESLGIPAGSGSIELPADGTRVEVDGLPVGAVVTFSEQDPVQVAGGAWEVPVIEPASVTVGADEVAEVRVTNTLTALVGDFSVKKLIEGTGAGLVPAGTTFTVGYEYPSGPGYEAGSGELTVPADGTVVTSGPLPAGAEVTLSEIAPATIEGGTWTGAEFSVDTLTIGESRTVEVALTNTISENPPPSANEPKTPGEKLSRTGGPGLAPGLIGAAILLVGAGGSILVARSLRRG
ncbi:hypothetical protein JD276_12810 [Leucobacter sp. CSA1]|uniref:DUF5979 domain-containing protein n=1 Tax=Leucobacter chromiisoli TaxID=2796471 RepID=A0A934UWH2_9MICO|nr:DUF5979 domain-containing protein [Leucobacter chromiisoli]MBK0419912.1 hypothetical protein [Leucobacter chromiisoli]